MASMDVMESAITASFMDKFVFHVVGLPHTQTTKEYVPCAYTEKVRKFCNMMKSLGHTVYLYASEENEAACDELVTCITKKEQREMLGNNNWKKDFFNIVWDENLPYWMTMNHRAVLEISKRVGKKDFICLIGGSCQKPIADAFPAHQVVEFGVGYIGIFAKHRVFESYSWMHNVYGMHKIENIVNYDAVIPNYFEVDDFPFSAKKEDYFLFIGRMISRKGAHIAAEVCGMQGQKLIMAGQGIKEIKDDGTIVSDELQIKGDHVKHVGTVNVKQRGELMSKAKAVFVLTQYIGPFEGVQIEANLCGTPVITTDNGCFTENVIDGLNGFRTRTLGEIIHAMKNVDKLDPYKIREFAIRNFSTERVQYQYQAYFESLHQLWDKGWYSEEYNPDNKRYFKFIQ